MLLFCRCQKRARARALLSLCSWYRAVLSFWRSMINTALLPLLRYATRCRFHWFRAIHARRKKLECAQADAADAIFDIAYVRCHRFKRETRSRGIPPKCSKLRWRESCDIPPQLAPLPVITLIPPAMPAMLVWLCLKAGWSGSVKTAEYSRLEAIIAISYFREE